MNGRSKNIDGELKEKKWLVSCTIDMGRSGK
jgi:hypothetical protein